MRYSARNNPAKRYLEHTVEPTPPMQRALATHTAIQRRSRRQNLFASGSEDDSRAEAELVLAISLEVA
jgi:hypothetical protein